MTQAQIQAAPAEAPRVLAMVATMAETQALILDCFEGMQRRLAALAPEPEAADVRDALAAFHATDAAAAKTTGAIIEALRQAALRIDDLERRLAALEGRT